MKKTSLKYFDQLVALDPDIARVNEAYAKKSDDLASAINEFEQLASNGSVLSMIYLAELYEHTDPPNIAKAINWYRAAADINSMLGLVSLGRIYYNLKRYDEAEEIFAKGVELNDIFSMQGLAAVYINTGRLEKKKNEILKLLQHASAHGQVRAQNTLSKILLKGRYGMRKIPEGIVLYIYSVLKSFQIALKNPNDTRLW